MTVRKIGCVSAIVLALLACSTAALAQERPRFESDVPKGIGTAPIHYNDSHLRLFGSFGSNIGLLGDAPVALSGMISYQRLHSALGAGFLSSSSTGGSQPFKNWFEADITYGYVASGNDFGYFGSDAKDFYIAASAGISFFNYQERWRFGRRFSDPIDTNVSHRNLSVAGVGIPVILQADYSVRKYVGFGVEVFANLNTYRINYGALVTLELIYP
ncbi:MAG TPA: hypothetical protein VEW28_00875 [Candidatus Kapabacteria bacterium]|nr:hypothetical protein [Candidatus Kapabacteria bacterium]